MAPACDPEAEPEATQRPATGDQSTPPGAEPKNIEMKRKLSAEVTPHGLSTHLWKFPEENDTFVDSLDLFFKDPVTEIKYTVSPFCAQGATVQTSKRNE